MKYNPLCLRVSVFDLLVFTKYNVLLFLCLLFLTPSCGTKKRLPPGVKSPQELSHQFGVRVTPEDNLYLYTEASKWLGTPHRMGGTTKRGIDCSGFVGNVYREVYGKQLARSSADMLKQNCRKVGRANLREGDLVFFATGSKRKTASHVGIYLKNGRFVHTSTSKGVIISNLSEPYYTRTWLTGGRVK